MTKIVVADTETASLEGGICDLAVIEVDSRFNEISRIESLIDPERPIGFAAMGVHHITEAMVWDAPTMDEFVEMHGNPFQDDDLIVAGHNIKFDLGVLKKWLPKEHRSICTLKLARQVLPEAENHQLGTLRYMLGLEAGVAHRAMGDTVTALSLLRWFSRRLNLDAFGLVDRMALPISMEMTMQFGKHRGMKLKDLPKSYVSWCVGQADFDPELIEAFKSHFFPGK